jgi:conjugal transfer pilus assembly protein TraW
MWFISCFEASIEANNNNNVLTKEAQYARFKFVWQFLAIFNLLLIANITYGVNLGVAGHTFPIIEIDILSVLQKRLSKFNPEDLAKLNLDMAREVRKRIERPRFTRLPRATEYRSFAYDPRIKITKDLKLDNKELEQYPIDVRLHIMKILKRHFSSNFISPKIKKAIWLEEIVFVKKGTIVDPLKYTFSLEPLLFIDSDDIEQVKWASAQRGKIVLVKGEPINLSNKLKREVYFDQVTRKGRLIERFEIKRLPARVSLPSGARSTLVKGRLLVEEIVV